MFHDEKMEKKKNKRQKSVEFEMVVKMNKRNINLTK